MDEIVSQNKETLRKHSGKKVWEVKPKVDWDKGKALSYLLEALKLNDRKDVISMYLGDDVTDEDAFEVLRNLSPLFASSASDTRGAPHAACMKLAEAAACTIVCAAGHCTAPTRPR